MKKSILALILILLVPAAVLASDIPWMSSKSDDQKATEAFNEGAKYSQAKQYDKAIPLYQKAVKLNPKFAEAYSNLGFALRETGKLDEGIKSYHKAIELKPDLVQAHEYLGVAYLKKGDKASALKEYETLKKLDPKEAQELWEEIEKYSQGGAK
jgi:superkiller protein 3